MTTLSNDDELQLKKRARRRLVGAVALVLLIVVFLPMILDNEPRPLNQDIAINIPPIPPKAELNTQGAIAPPNETGLAVPPAKTHVAGLPEGPSTRTEDVSNLEPTSTPPRPASAETKSAKPAQKHQAKTVASVQGTADEAFVVQLGAFSNAINAKTLQKKLQDNKFKAYTELIKNPGGDRTRVRVGPYPTRDAAEKARDRLKAMKLVIGEAAVVRRD